MAVARSRHGAPQQFIALAEETSLIVPIGDWILEQACLDLRRFQCQWDGSGRSPRELFISVNIAVRQFQEPDFCAKLLALVDRYQVKAENLKLEVTERIFLAEAEAISAIGQCRAAGFQVSLDDFGTGYSSLNYLERCEIDSLKIDQSFTQKICTSPRAKVIVGAIINIAQDLGLPTVAEGIETPEQRQMLQDMGCDIGQGYWFSQPLPVRDILALLG